MKRHDRNQSGFTLVELLIVAVLIGILSVLLVPAAAGSSADHLRAAAKIVTSDLAYARSLAVSYGSTYRVTFDFDANAYAIEHSGANALLDASFAPTVGNGASPGAYIVDLDELPRLGTAVVRLVAVGVMGSSPQPATEVEFGPLGETTAAEETQVWLSFGTGDGQRFLQIRVDPVTGVAWSESPQLSGPASSIVPAGP